MMFKKYLNASTYNEERTKSRVRKQQMKGEDIIGFYTEMFLRPDDARLARRLSPRRMDLKDFASVRYDDNLQCWEERILTITK